MKISEMSMNRAADTMIRLSGSLGNILNDEQIEKLFTDTGFAGKANPLKGYAMFLTQLVPACLRTHRNDLFDVVAALDEKTPEEVGNLKVGDVIKILRESVDKELLDFLRSFGGLTKTAENA